MDIDSAIFEAPYYHKIVIDKKGQALAPLLTFREGMITCVQEKYQQEESIASHSVEQPHLASLCSQLLPLLHQAHKLP
ncbi:MAG: hypothetical protein QNJ27_02495 [Simkaniaceae bacterium]|nr:hypothetical protein [Simkaniaceae bacterium]